MSIYFPIFSTSSCVKASRRGDDVVHKLLLTSLNIRDNQKQLCNMFTEQVSAKAPEANTDQLPALLLPIKKQELKVQGAPSKDQSQDQERSTVEAKGLL